ncbi:MAG: corrinoid protein [Deltaproteobacteria bacterium]|nr:corrinoid protein [Deltaproteobacteria bacterium]
MIDFSELMKAIIDGQSEAVTGLVKKALHDGVGADDILNNGLIKGMDIVGEKMQNGDLFIPEVLQSAQCMNASLEILKPLLSTESTVVRGKIVIGTVKGDLHDIGKNLVKMMMESTGFEVTDLGVDVAPEHFIKAIKERNANIVALSALLTTTMPMMKKTIDALVESGLRDKVKVMIGGAPVTQTFADEIGADGFASDAGSASKLAKNFA